MVTENQSTKDNPIEEFTADLELPSQRLSMHSHSEESMSSSDLSHQNIAQPDSASLHPMVTRSKVGIVKPNPYPNPKYALNSSVEDISEPVTIKQTLAYPGWLGEMKEELKALEDNDTWELVEEDS